MNPRKRLSRYPKDEDAPLAAAVLQLLRPRHLVWEPEHCVQTAERVLCWKHCGDRGSGGVLVTTGCEMSCLFPFVECYAI